MKKIFKLFKRKRIYWLPLFRSGCEDQMPFTLAILTWKTKQEVIDRYGDHKDFLTAVKIKFKEY